MLFSLCFSYYVKWFFFFKFWFSSCLFRADNNDYNYNDDDDDDDDDDDSSYLVTCCPWRGRDWTSMRLSWTEFCSARLEILLIYFTAKFYSHFKWKHNDDDDLDNKPQLSWYYWREDNRYEAQQCIQEVTLFWKVGEVRKFYYIRALIDLYWKQIE